MQTRRKEPVRKRFAKHVKLVESGCHEWQSTLNQFGYDYVRRLERK